MHTKGALLYLPREKCCSGHRGVAGCTLESIAGSHTVAYFNTGRTKMHAACVLLPPWVEHHTACHGRLSRCEIPGIYCALLQSHHCANSRLAMLDPQGSRHTEVHPRAACICSTEGLQALLDESSRTQTAQLLPSHLR